MAAGLSMQEKDVDAFREKINGKCRLTPEDLEEKVHIDVAMPLSYISKGLIEELELLEPFGIGNTKPVFAARNVRVLESRILGKNQNVLRMKLVDESGMPRDGIFFSGCMQQVLEDLQERQTVHMLYYPEVNEFRGERNLQLRILNYR